MWETTFPRNSHAGLGKPINEDDILPSMHETSFSPCPIRRGYFSEMLFPTWLKRCFENALGRVCCSSLQNLRTKSSPDLFGVDGSHQVVTKAMPLSAVIFLQSLEPTVQTQGNMQLRNRQFGNLEHENTRSLYKHESQI